MTFSTNTSFQAPDGLNTDEFILRPLRTTDVELDYAAVMGSKRILRAWSQSDWPADDFTLAGNHEDLARHEREHIENVAYTYTVLNPAGTECLGCVYIHTPAARSYSEGQITALDETTPWSAYDALIYFWARESRLADGLDQRLLMALHQWFNAEWHLPQHLFVTSEQFTQQIALLESAGLHLRFRVRRRKGDGDYLAYTYA